MDSMEPKKLALIRVLEILQKYSDEKHPLTQDDILSRLNREYGIVLERKAVGRNLSLLREAGYEIVSTGAGCYLSEREFENSELQLLIDGVLASKHINPTHSKELIEKLSALASPSYRRTAKNIYTVNEWDKTESPALFFTIEVIDEAIETGRQIEYDYNKYGADRILHRTSHQRHTPYLLILHNQKYYLMSLNEKFKTLSYCRVDRITDIRVTEDPATDIHTIPGFENGIDYKRFSTAMPYMFADQPERIDFLADEWVLDQVVDWFGKDIRITPTENEKQYRVSVLSSPNAMEFWALQYAGAVEILTPIHLREKVKQRLEEAVKKYKNDIGD